MRTRSFVALAVSSNPPSFDVGGAADRSVVSESRREEGNGECRQNTSRITKDLPFRRLAACRTRVLGLTLHAEEI